MSKKSPIGNPPRDRKKKAAPVAATKIPGMLLTTPVKKDTPLPPSSEKK